VEEVQRWYHRDLHHQPSQGGCESVREDAHRLVAVREDIVANGPGRSYFATFDILAVVSLSVSCSIFVQNFLLLQFSFYAEVLWLSLQSVRRKCFYS
jgi:hypothetical protein